MARTLALVQAYSLISGVRRRLGVVGVLIANMIAGGQRIICGEQAASTALETRWARRAHLLHFTEALDRLFEEDRRAFGLRRS
jgi:hypothetical protein